MNRRDFIKLAGISGGALLASGCGLFRIDPWNVLIRSDRFKTLSDAQKVVDKGKLFSTEDERMRVLILKGDPYQRGYQQGALLRDEIQVNLKYIHRQILRKFRFPEMFDEVYDRMRPFIPEEYTQEMRGLAHGAEIPLSMVHHFHVLPDIGEWGGKKRITKIIKGMMRGDPPDLWGTMCSNFTFKDEAASDKGFYAVRVLDWGLHRLSKLHKFATIAINIGDDGSVPSANIGWAGFLGAVSGMNAQGITLGEMGYGDSPEEHLNGIPMCFMLRDVMSKTKTLAEARDLIRNAKGTNAYVFLISDGKSRTSEIYFKDHQRFMIFKPGEEIVEESRKIKLPGIPDILYGGHYRDRMTEILSQKTGQLNPDFVMKEVIPKIAMPSNFQNVIYDASGLKFWVANATNKYTRAADTPYSYFDFGAALREYR
jgi:hypothetical protein